MKYFFVRIARSRPGGIRRSMAFLSLATSQPTRKQIRLETMGRMNACIGYIYATVLREPANIRDTWHGCMLNRRAIAFGESEQRKPRISSTWLLLNLAWLCRSFLAIRFLTFASFELSAGVPSRKCSGLTQAGMSQE